MTSAWEEDYLSDFGTSEHYGVAPAVQPPPKQGWLYRFWRDRWGMDVMEQPHVGMAAYLENALGDCTFDGEERLFLMLGVPRGTFKTTGFSEASPVAVLERNPNANILLDGFRHSVSKARLRAIRRKIENDEQLGLQVWKPPYRGATWNDEEIIITARDDYRSREASIATSGVDRSMNSQHFDLIVADDLVTDTNCRTPDARQIVYDHIIDLRPILNPGGVLVLVFTTWHVDDAYMRLIKLDDARERRGMKRDWQTLIRSCYDGPNGLYFPIDGRGRSRLTHEFLEKEKESMGSHKFSAQYLLKPIAPEDKTFNMGLARIVPFTFFTTAERVTGGIVRAGTGQYDVDTTIAWDPAGRKPRRTTDSHGLTVVGTDVDSRWWIVDAFGLKAKPSEVIARVIRLIQTYRPWSISIEDTFGSGLWIDLLALELVRLNMAVRIEEYQTGGVPKESRIELLQPRWESGSIILRADSDGMPMHAELLRQVDDFSPGAPLDHEDVLDSLVQHLTLTRPPSASETRVETNPIDQEYLDLKARRKEESQARRGPLIWTP